MRRGKLNVRKKYLMWIAIILIGIIIISILIIKYKQKNLLLSPLEDCQKTDITKDGKVNIDDLSIFAANWQKTDCSDSNSFCQGADITKDGKVDIDDQSFLAANYGKQCLNENQCQFLKSYWKATKIESTSASISDFEGPFSANDLLLLIVESSSECKDKEIKYEVYDENNNKKYETNILFEDNLAILPFPIDNLESISESKANFKASLVENPSIWMENDPTKPIIFSESQPNKNCIDTDNPNQDKSIEEQSSEFGLVIQQMSKCTSIEEIKAGKCFSTLILTDVCTEENTLSELTCKDNSLSSETITCENGCKNGVCVK